MQRRDGLLAVISIVLVISMFVGLGFVLTKGGYAQPDNPLGSHGPLIPDVLDGGGNLTGNGEEQSKAETPVQETVEQGETDEPEETEPEETQPEEEKPEPQPEEEVGDHTPDNDNGGNSDSDNIDNGPAGDDGDGPGTNGDTPGSGEDDSLKIVTDLRSQQVTRSELPEGVLKFYAYPSQDRDGLSIKVVVNNSTTSLNGQVLTSSDGIHYEVDLVLNETTTITLYLKENGENLSYVRYQIRYEAEKADEDNPEVGDYPPSIVTNLDGFTDVMETQDFLFWVSAKTNPAGDPIYSNQIEVWLDGNLVPKQTGDVRPEYELHFAPPNVGDYARYTVKVRAWDGKGNSTMKVYTVNYHTVSEGDYLGQVKLVLDASTVGLGIIDTATYEIVQGDTAAGVVIKFLEDYGYDCVYDGNATLGFYLRSISRGDLCRGAKVPEKLWEMILRDNIPLSGTSDRDSLGEFDYTMGSGWMYSIDGSIYPGRGLSDYKLSKDTTIYLRFTLAYGKDIGGSGQGYGSLDGYCGMWIGGSYIPLEHSFEETHRVEATETEEGVVDYVCSKCGESKQEVLPVTGPPSEDPETPPPETEPPTEPPETEPPETEPPESEPSTEPPAPEMPPPSENEEDT